MSAINEILDEIQIPKVTKVKQSFDKTKLEDVEGTLHKLLIQKNVKDKIKKDLKIAITGGSREISNYKELMKIVVDFVKENGGHPFIVPSMGSHGGGAAKGQEKMLEKLGITEKSVGAPILSSMEVVEIGKTEKEIPVYIDKNAYEADGIILLNRIKMHTSFRGEYESGLVKMLAIGLAKRKGADMTHSLRYENMAKNIVAVGKVGIEKLNIICGIATIENGYDEVAEIFVLHKEEILKEEPKILQKSIKLMPQIYLDNIDVLIVKEIGKNISGTGMDTNIIGRFHTNAASGGPNTIKLGLLNLSYKSDGNGNGMGLADFISKKFYNKLDLEATYLNAITSTEPNSVKLPVVLDNDKYVFKACVKICGKRNIEDIKLVIIDNTKNLEEVYMSCAAIKNIMKKEKVEIIGEYFEIKFDRYGNYTI
ncbi:lactate racemase domain-containing protein [Romboutsia sp.]|uniref:lactate racemase domain-containing protein n=1 Tax=Romboutsia sp. TaxID=1965302 RepID=UPI003F2F11B8